MILGDPACLELEARPAGIPAIRVENNRLTLAYPEMECEQRGTIPSPSRFPPPCGKTRSAGEWT